MFSPSDYNDAVPQFTNGNYANTPLNPLYIEEPDAVNYNRGVEPVQTLPAQWWNWLCNQFTAKLNKLNVYVKNIFDELAQLLSLVNITPDATESDITIGQLKGMFQTTYPKYLYDNYEFESLLQGRTKGVILVPTDTWDNDTDTLSLTDGFGILNTNKKVIFATSSLILPNDGQTHYIVSDADGVITIEDSLGNDVILVGLCNDKEYCLLADNDINQCKDSIILGKWFGQNKISQGFVSILQSYYSTSIASIETNVSIDIANNAIDGIAFKNCIINIDTIGSGNSWSAMKYGIVSGTFEKCIVNINTISNDYSTGIKDGTFKNCTININTISNSKGNGIDIGTFENCAININIINNSAIGIKRDSKLVNCIIKINSIDSGTGMEGTNLIVHNSTIIIDLVENSGRGMGGGRYYNSSIVIDSIKTGSKGFNFGNYFGCTALLNNVLRGSTAVDSANFLNCYVNINIGDANANNRGVTIGFFNCCFVAINEVVSGTGMANSSNVYLYLTRVNCSTITSLSSTNGKLNVLNNTVLHTS